VVKGRAAIFGPPVPGGRVVVEPPLRTLEKSAAFPSYQKGLQRFPCFLLLGARISFCICISRAASVYEQVPCQQPMEDECSGSAVLSRGATERMPPPYIKSTIRPRRPAPGAAVGRVTGPFRGAAAFRVSRKYGGGSGLGAFRRGRRESRCYFFPESSSPPPTTRKATPAHTGTLTRCFSLMEISTGPSFASWVSLV